MTNQRTQWSRQALWITSAFLFIACTRMLFAQTSEDAIDARLLHKPLFLRGLQGVDDLKFEGDGRPKSPYKRVPFTVSGIDVTKVQLSFGRLFLEGQRVGLVFDENGNMSRLPLTMGDPAKNPKPEKISIMVDRTSDGDFGPALDAVFAASLAELVPSMPGFWQAYAQQYFTAKGEQSPEIPNAPRRARIPNPPDVVPVAGNIQPPKVIARAKPEYGEYARRMKFAHRVELYLVVDEAGSPQDIAIAKPGGMGLDEQAVAAVSQYRFAPATRDGTPVKVNVFMDVNFEIH